MVGDAMGAVRYTFASIATKRSQRTSDVEVALANKQPFPID